MDKVTDAEIATAFFDFLSRTTDSGEEFLITRGGKPVATLSPVKAPVRLADLPEILSAGPQIDPEDVSAFSDDLKGVRVQMNEPVSDQWD